MREVVIVGGGHNGLVCAAYLARAGHDVLVLERRDVLGGAAVTEEPWPGHRVSSASYVVSLVPPRIERELELKRHGYRVSIISPDYYVPFPDETALTLWGEVERDAKEIARLSRKDAEAYAEFDVYFERIAGLLRDLLFIVPPNLTLADLPRWLALGGRMRRWSGRDIAEITRLFTLSAADFLEEWFEDERIKGALATQAMVGAWGGPMSPGSAYVLMHHWIGEVDGHAGAWGWVHGGMGGISEALAAAARSAGAEIRLDSPVDHVLIRDGRAVGVELENGETIEARRVISNAHPITTYLELVGERHLPEDVVRDIRRYRTRSGSVKVNASLSKLPTPAAWRGDVPGDPHRGLVAIAPSIEYLERAWDDAKYGRPSSNPYVEAVFPTVHEPALAPEGRHLMLAFVQYGPYELAEGGWDDQRDAFGGRVIETLGRYMPDIESAVEQIEVLTPPDIERRFGLLGGNIMQGEMTPDQSFFLRPILGYADYTTPIEGLFVCGSGTHPGGGVMGVPGYNCAQVVDRAARRDSSLLGRLRNRAGGAVNRMAEQSR
jgi:phytoene dehydrogenase-like protein